MSPVSCMLCDAEPAVVYCVNDDANLCHACDVKCHSGNPLAARHERRPLAPGAELEAHSSACRSVGWRSEASAEDYAVVPEWRPAGTAAPEPQHASTAFSCFADDQGELPMFDFDLADLPLGSAAMDGDLDLADCGIVPVFAGDCEFDGDGDVEALLSMFPIDQVRRARLPLSVLLSLEGQERHVCAPRALPGVCPRPRQPTDRARPPARRRPPTRARRSTTWRRSAC